MTNEELKQRLQRIRINEEMAKDVSAKQTADTDFTHHNLARGRMRIACEEMANRKDKQFVKELRKVLEFSASPVDMEDEINNLIQKYENQ